MLLERRLLKGQDLKTWLTEHLKIIDLELGQVPHLLVDSLIGEVLGGVVEDSELEALGSSIVVLDQVKRHDFNGLKHWVVLPLSRQQDA